ncbi:phosphotransferase [Photobacterium damselae]|uniref:choline kinase family protein n=1 Tax=Photobacterium damselae TaxID=38293 RepID=UPI0025426CC3
MSCNVAIILCANQAQNNPISNYLLNNKPIYSYIVDSLKYYNIDKIYLLVDDYNLTEYNCKDCKLLPISSDKVYGLHSLCSIEIEEDFDNLFIIDGNIFFDRRGILELINSSEKNAVIVSNPRDSDWYFTPSIENGVVAYITQNENIKSNTKELLGLYKVDYDLYIELKNLYYNGSNFSIDDALLNTKRKIASIYIDDYICYKIRNKIDLLDLINVYEPRVQRIYNNHDEKSKVYDLVGSKLNKEVTSFKSLGGMTNKNYHIQTNDDNEFVIRIPGKGTDSLINRCSEMDNTFIAASLGIDIKPDFFCNQSGIKITPFIHNAETLNPDTIKLYIRDCINLLKQLHFGNEKFKNIFNIKSELNKYYDVINNKNFYENLTDIKELIFSLIDKYSNNNIYFSSCHNDTVAENFIRSSNRYYLIDWEYAALNDPMWDLAALFIENNFSNKLIDKSLVYYFGRQPFIDELKRLKLCYLYQDFLWTLWAIVKCEAGTDYFEYGHMRYLRLKDNIRLFDDL